MKGRWLLKVATVASCVVLGSSMAQAGGRFCQPAPDSPAACGDHGTSIRFYDTPQAAATQAAREQKLVFILHVSGNFEDPGLT